MLSMLPFSFLLLLASLILGFHSQALLLNFMAGYLVPLPLFLVVLGYSYDEPVMLYSFFP